LSVTLAKKCGHLRLQAERNKPVQIETNPIYEACRNGYWDASCKCKQLPFDGHVDHKACSSLHLNGSCKQQEASISKIIKFDFETLRTIDCYRERV
jgi:hypothetical protein